MISRKSLFSVLAGLAAVSAGAALAQTPFESGVHDAAADAPAQIYQRYFAALSGAVNPSATNNCGTAGANVETAPDGSFCKLVVRTTATAFYRGYSENTSAFGITPPDGQEYQSAFDMQTGAGTPNHVGYYGWTAKVVNASDTSKANVKDCTGLNAGSCLGNANTANSTDRSGVPNTDGGAAGVQRYAGLSPIPAPRVTNYNRTTGVINLGWDAVTSNTGGKTAAGYDIFQATGVKSGTTCPAPSDAQLVFLKSSATNSATVNRSELASTPGDNKCATFAIKLNYGNNTGGPIKSRYVSSNGQAINLDGGGGAASVFDITAKWASANNIEVNWKTSLEDGVRGFYVTRATTENGAYVRISSLIAAKGEPSAYTFVDAVPTQGVQKATGLYYKVETVDIDDNVAAFGPAKAQLPVPGKGVIQQRNKANRK